MNGNPSCGRAIVTALASVAVIAAAAAASCYVMRNLIAFCAVYDEPVTPEPLSFDEIEEMLRDGGACENDPKAH
ncbi:MAG: hypothetical protein IKC75_07150 [Clostridia bacterium]|nr:hypothetical protein [Clostridia bacterium]